MDEERTAQAPSLDQLEKEVDVTTYQASGPGGQHRNRTYSAVRMTHRPTGIIVTAADSRSQLRNRKIALERLYDRLVDHFKIEAPRVPTQKSQGTRRRERVERDRISTRKKLRKTPDPEQD